jgi:hypothetical protein
MNIEVHKCGSLRGGRVWVLKAGQRSEEIDRWRPDVGWNGKEERGKKVSVWAERGAKTKNGGHICA